MKNSKNLNEKKQEILHNLVKYHGLVTVACRHARVGRTMYYEYLKNDEDFAFKVNQLQEAFLDFTESKLIELIMLGDRAAIMFYLKAKGGNRGYS